MRQCSECFTLKPSTAFSSSQRRKSASKQRCTACTGAAAAAPSKRNAPAARSLPAAMKSMSRQLREDEEAEAVVRDRPLVDIGINLTNSQFKRDWKAVVARAQRAGVVTMLLTGTSLKASRKSLDMARAWRVEQGAELDATALRCTVGVHPHDASTFAGDATLGAMRDMLSDPLTVAVGECGLDYNRMKCPKAVQMRCFRAQLELAVELDRPVFVHEREAHDDLVAVTDAVAAAVAPRPLPPIVIHCFTGTLAEAQGWFQQVLIAIFSSLLSVPPLAHTRSLAHTLSLILLLLSHSLSHTRTLYTYVSAHTTPSFSSTSFFSVRCKRFLYWVHWNDLQEGARCAAARAAPAPPARPHYD